MSPSPQRRPLGWSLASAIADTPGSAWIIVGLFVVYLAWFFMPRGDSGSGYRYHSAGLLPVQADGRLKPIDTMARAQFTSVYIPIMNAYQFFTGDDKETHSAMEWYTKVMLAELTVAKDHPIQKLAYIHIDDKELAQELKLPEKANNLYSIGDFQDHFETLFDEATLAVRTPTANRSDRQKFVAKFERDISRVLALVNDGVILHSLTDKVFRIESEEVVNELKLEHRPGMRYSFAEVLPGLTYLYQSAAKANEVPAKKRTLRENQLLAVSGQIKGIIRVARLDGHFVIPPPQGEEWLNLRQAFEFQKMRGAEGAGDPYFLGYSQMLQGKIHDNPETFNKGVEACLKELEKRSPDLLSRLRLEVYFNDSAPFFHLFVLNMVIFLLACGSWMVGFQTLNRAGFWAMVLLAFVSTWALLVRMYLQGRPPVTNLYSSAIFIGWGASLVCIFGEVFFRNSVSLVVGSICGGLSLLVANYLGMSGDTLESLQAVLDTNFWLATHVTSITFGYAATFFAGFLGVCYIVLGLFTRKLEGNGAPLLTKLMYGVICFAMFLSFTGTVLGGIWADQSWGRFWGWDPKENGALLIVIWNALILHGRWGGMVKGREMAQLAVLGNGITAWSWFGTNLLGVGLHSYGFMQGAMTWLIIFWSSQALIALLGFVPLCHWKSFQPHVKKPPESTLPPATEKAVAVSV